MTNIIEKGEYLGCKWVIGFISHEKIYQCYMHPIKSYEVDIKACELYNIHNQFGQLFSPNDFSTVEDAKQDILTIIEKYMQHQYLPGENKYLEYEKKLPKISDFVL